MIFSLLKVVVGAIVFFAGSLSLADMFKHSDTDFKDAGYITYTMMSCTGLIIIFC